MKHAACVDVGGRLVRDVLTRTSDGGDKLHGWTRSRPCWCAAVWRRRGHAQRRTRAYMHGRVRLLKIWRRPVMGGVPCGSAPPWWWAMRRWCGRPLLSPGLRCSGAQGHACRWPASIRRYACAGSPWAGNRPWARLRLARQHRRASCKEGRVRRLPAGAQLALRVELAKEECVTKSRGRTRGSTRRLCPARHTVAPRRRRQLWRRAVRRHCVASTAGRAHG